MILVAISAVGLTTGQAANRDMKELARIHRGIDGVNGSIWFCEHFRPKPDQRDTLGLFPGSRWELLSCISVPHPPIKTWDDERAAFDKQISEHKSKLRLAEKRRDQIRRRWLYLL
jgi:hypothetical protein